jgi:hypothetical protein
VGSIPITRSINAPDAIANSCSSVISNTGDPTSTEPATSTDFRFGNTLFNNNYPSGLHLTGGHINFTVNMLHQAINDLSANNPFSGFLWMGSHVRHITESYGEVGKGQCLSVSLSSYCKYIQ